MSDKAAPKKAKRENPLSVKNGAATCAQGVQRRHNSRPALENHLRFERLISDLSFRFVNIAPDQVDGEIEYALEQVLVFFQIDRCGLLGISPDRKRAHVTHAAYAEGIERVTGDVDLAALFPWCYEKLVMQGEPVCFCRIEALPEEADQDRANHAAMGILSTLDIPLFLEGKVSSIIVINALRRHCSWPEEYVLQLRLLGDIFVTALERKRADQALRGSEERLRDITFSMADWMWEVDDNGVYTYSSAKGSEILGRPHEDIIGKTPFDFMPPDEAERVAAIFSEIASKKAPIKDLENWNIGKDGENICLLTNGVPMLDEEGNLKGYRGVDKDITERKQLQDQLRTAAEEWHRTFNTIQDMIMIMDREFRIVRMNDAVIKFFGLPKEKLLGTPCYTLMHGTENPIDGCPYKKMLETKEHEETEVYDELRGKWFHVGVDPLFGAKGDIVGVVHTVKDITEYKRAWIARMESMERYQAVVEAFDGFIYICTPDYRVEFMNQRLIERTGRNAVGETCYMALHDRDSICEWCVNERAFQGETVRWEVQSPKDHRWYYVVNTPIRHADGTISKQSMIMDITERKQSEEALRESEAALRNSQKDLHRLAGRLISAQEEELRRLSRELHDDLTQRLAVLAIEAGKLELDLNKISEVYPDTVRKISQMKEQMIKISEDVHRISRQLHPTILDDLGLVRAIESECAMLMKREDIEIAFERVDVPSMIPKGTALCLYRIVQEGLRNIIRHSHAGDAEIFLKGTDSNICLTVRDAGIGFDPAEVRQKPGLGLASMRERIQLIQGDFSIRSQPGQGTVINVCVPLTGGEA